MKVLKKNKLGLFLFLAILISCSDLNQQFYYSKTKKNVHYKTEFKYDTLVFYRIESNKNILKKDSSFFVKKDDGFYEIVNDPFTNFNKRLRLSTSKDTFYDYKVVSANFYCRISKIDNQHFKTVYANYDSLVYKFRNSIYYDKNYNIYKIENIFNDEKNVYLPNR